MRIPPSAIGFPILLLVLGCGELRSPTAPPPGGEPVDPSATFTRVQNEVFTPSCASLGCHDTIGQQSQLVLSSGRAYAQIVGVASVEMPNVQRVTPNDPAASYLYRKVVGTGITGERMPQGGPPLSEEKIRLIRDWIRRGAPND
jgi:hypothetical protein